MKRTLTYEKHVFHFKIPSGTSRGVLTEKKSWILSIFNDNEPEIKGIGECSVIPGLSPDFIDDEQYESKLDELVNDQGIDLTDFPSIKFGLESALIDLNNGGQQIYFDNEFTRGKRKIPINGLVWMGEEAFMQMQIDAKLTEGYKTIKMKIGAIDLQTELTLLKKIREKHKSDEITLRVDANGAFDEENVSYVLTELAKLEIHSIEQPIKAGQWDLMHSLCESTPTPIALDEELIGVNDFYKKVNLLDTIEPQFIILKPSLHGGISGTQEWIQLVEERNIPWWITSALESNVGLNTICQLAGNYENELPQGLGTGSLYKDNIPSKLKVSEGAIELTNKIQQ